MLAPFANALRGSHETPRTEGALVQPLDRVGILQGLDKNADR